MNRGSSGLSRIIKTYAIPVLIPGGLIFGVYIGLLFRSRGSEEWITVIEVSTSIILSVALVLIYAVQNQILERQSEIMSGGHTPAISVEGVEFDKKPETHFSDSADSSEKQIDVIQFDAINRGNDVATDIAVLCRLSNDWSPAEIVRRKCIRLLNYIPKLSFDHKTKFHSRRLDLESEDLLTETRQSDGPVLPPNMDTAITLYGNIGVDYSPDVYCSIPDACDILASEKVDTAHLEISLVYENAFDEVYEMPLKSLMIEDIEAGLSFEEIVNKSKRVPRES